MNPLSGIGALVSFIFFVGTTAYLATMGIRIISAPQPVVVTFLEHETLHFLWGALTFGWVWMILGAIMND